MKSDIPKTWKWVTLNDISVTSSGGTPDRKNSSYFNGNIPWVKSGELNYNTIIDSEEYISEEALEFSSAKIFSKNSLLIALYGNTVGRMAFLGVDAATNQAVASITPFLINPKYLFYYLMSSKEDLLNKREGSAQPNISQRVLNEFPFPLAPIEEQNRIVDKIEELFSNIDDSVKQINVALEKTNVYVKKTIYEQFKGHLLQDNTLKELPSFWKWKKLFQIGTIYSGGTPSTTKNEYWGGEISWVTPADLSNYNEVYISHGRRFISQLGLDKSSAKLLPKGTILFSTRAPIGYVVIAKNDIATNQGFKNIIINEGNNNLYVYYYLKSITDYAKKIASGTTFLELSTNKFKEIPIAVAPINEQINIVNVIENAIIYGNKLTNELNYEKQKIESTKQKILQESFHGRLSKQFESDSNSENLLIKIKHEKKKYLISKIEIKKSRQKFEKKEIVLLKYLENKFGNNIFTYDEVYNELNMPQEILIREFKKLEKEKKIIAFIDESTITAKYNLL